MLTNWDVGVIVRHPPPFLARHVGWMIKYPIMTTDGTAQPVGNNSIAGGVEQIVPQTEVVDAPEQPKGVKKPPFSRAALASWERKYKADLAVAPDDGIVQVDETTAIVAAKILGKNKKDWGVRAMRAKQQLGQYLNQPLQLRRILAIECMDSMDQIKMTIEAGAKLAQGIKVREDDKSEIQPADRAKAVQAVAMALEAQVEMSNHLLKLAESANPSQASPSDKPQNAPPDFGLQLTTPDGTTASVVAKSGGS